MELTAGKENSIDFGTDRVKNPFESVIQKYEHAIGNQARRMVRQRRDFYTKHEQVAIAFYKDALSKIEGGLA